MLAPMRRSSGTCMKRFSKIVSVIIAAPSATRHQRHELRLHVGREAGIGLGHHVDAVQPPLAARDAQAALGLLEQLDAGLAQRRADGVEDARAAPPSSSTSPPVIAAAMA